MYIARHDRIVDLIVKDISNHVSPLVRVYKHSFVKPYMFQYLSNHSEMFSDLSANTPDVVVINEECREVYVLEIVCTFESSMEEAFLTKVIKYQPLYIISEIGYRGRLLVFIFGSLGHTQKLVVRGLQQLGMPQKRAKWLAKYCSPSAIIGSCHIWRRRRYLYPQQLSDMLNIVKIYRMPLVHDFLYVYLTASVIFVSL